MESGRRHLAFEEGATHPLVAEPVSSPAAKPQQFLPYMLLNNSTIGEDVGRVAFRESPYAPKRVLPAALEAAGACSDKPLPCGVYESFRLGRELRTAARTQRKRSFRSACSRINERITRYRRNVKSFSWPV